MYYEIIPKLAPLSRSAQAVMLSASGGNLEVLNDPLYRQRIACALKEAIDQVVQEQRGGDA